jgi:hypothetical protein
MKSFLCKGKYPIIKWSRLPQEIYFEGPLPKGYSLAIVPGDGYIVIDVDRHGNVDGFNNIPKEHKEELYKTLNYPTKNNGRHFWFRYKDKKVLGNKASKFGIDIRVNNKGYVIWYPSYDIRDNLDSINVTSNDLNDWLVELFSYKNKKTN